MNNEIVENVVAAVEAYYAEHDKPLLLSRFGQLNPDLIRALRVESATLVEAIKAAGERLTLMAPAGTRGRDMVAPGNRGQEMARTLNETHAAVESHSNAFDSLPFTVQISFCVRKEADEVIALRTTPPFRYGRFASQALVRPGFAAIPEEYRRPGLMLKNASAEDKDGLWKGFLAWCEISQLDPNSFTSTQRSNALARLLAAQDPMVLSQLVIPADIAALLLKRH